MKEIPEDIVKTAEAIVNAMPEKIYLGFWTGLQRSVEHAILAERKRCRDIAMSVTRNGEVITAAGITAGRIMGEV